MRGRPVSPSSCQKQGMIPYLVYLTLHVTPCRNSYADSAHTIRPTGAMPMVALHCIPRDARQRHSDTVSVTELQRHCHKILRTAVLLEARCSMPWPFFVLVKTRPQVTRLHERRSLVPRHVLACLTVSSHLDAAAKPRGHEDTNDGVIRGPRVHRPSFWTQTARVSTDI